MSRTSLSPLFQPPSKRPFRGLPGAVGRLLIVVLTLGLTVAEDFTGTAAAASNCAVSGSANLSASSTCVCPFCSSIALTFTEQMNNSDVVIVAKLLEVPEPISDPDADFPKATFEIVSTYKGEQFVKAGMTFKTQLVGRYPVGQKFLVMGVQPPSIAWTTPMKASDRVFEYLEKVRKLPESGPERLNFFQDYFEDKESVLAFDAYDEYAKAPYEDLIAMKPMMNREYLIDLINTTESVSRRKLYFTMLGVCGKPEDTKFLEELLTSDSNKKKRGLDALIACYLSLKGEAGVELIEKEYLINKQVDYVDTLNAIEALRFHATETDKVPRQRIVEAIRHLLDRPKMADMVIADLARWEDWTVMERLVEMFKEATPENNWLRVPIATYLRTCPKPEAKAYIAELQKLDPEAIRRADFYLGFGEEIDDEDDETEDSETSQADGGKADAGSQPATESSNSGGGGEAEFAGDFTSVDSVDGLAGELDEVTTTQVVVRKVSLLDESATDSAGNESDAVLESDTLDESDCLDEPDSRDESNGSATRAPTQTFATAADADQSLAGVDTGVETASVEPSLIAPNPPTTANPATASSVDTFGGFGDFRVAQVELAQNSAAAPAATLPVAYSPVAILLVPMAISASIFLLMWSVVNGWFERLIF